MNEWKDAIEGRTVLCRVDHEKLLEAKVLNRTPDGKYIKLNNDWFELASVELISLL